MDEKLKNIIEKVTEVNIKLIENGKEVIPTCIIPKDDKLVGIAISFQNPQEKNMFKVILKRLLAESGTKVYVTSFDVKMTMTDKGKFKQDTTQVKDCILITAYTPNEKYMVAYPYKDKVIDMENKVVLQGRTDIKDEWDLWGENVDKFAEEYSKFREDNPNLYGDENGK